MRLWQFVFVALYIAGTCDGLTCSCRKCTRKKRTHIDHKDHHDRDHDHNEASTTCSWSGWNGWGGWGSCSRSCGGGVRIRYNTCPCSNPDSQAEPCNVFCLNSGTLTDVCLCMDEYYGFCCEQGLLYIYYNALKHEGLFNQLWAVCKEFCH